MDQKLQQFIGLVNSMNNMELLEYLINNCGPELPLIKTQTNVIHGCISKLYLSSDIKDGKLYFEITGESKISQGMGRLLCNLFSGQSPREILEFPFSKLEDINYKAWLTNSRQNGFKQVFIRIKDIAKNSQT